MKPGNFIFILAVLSVIACFVMPVMADQNTTKDQATLFYNAGEQYLSTSDYQDAVAAYDQALASNLTNMEQGEGLRYLYHDKSYALIQLNQTDEALQTINDGLALYGDDAMLWNNKGYVLSLEGNYQDALTAYNAALTYGQNTTISNGLVDQNVIVQIFNNKGDLLYKMGQYQGAVDAYNQALALSPGNSYSENGLALAQKAAGSASSQMMIILVIVVIIVAGSAVWYIKFRKPAEKTEAEPKNPKNNKK